MIDWEQNNRLAAEIATNTSPQGMMRFEALIQHFATKNTMGDDKYSGGSWGVHKTSVAIEEDVTQIGYYMLLETDQKEFTVNCLGMMTTVQMTPETLSYAVSLHAANHLNMEAFQMGNSKDNQFWHDAYWAVYHHAREQLSEDDFAKILTYLD